MNRLLSYLETHGILLCNVNPYLPALEDIGCAWRDVVELIDSRQLFYCKAFRKRTTYLSREAYYLLKDLRPRPAMTPAAAAIYAVLEGNPPMEAAFLKRVASLPPKEFQQGFDFLLQNLYVTALANGVWKNENWSSFCYGTAEAWEALAPMPAISGNAGEQLRELLGPNVPEKQLRELLGRTGGVPVKKREIAKNNG